MKINVGSKNKIKIQAVKDAVALYPKIFPNAEVVGVDVNVEQFGHPKNAKETIDGAVARAKAAFTDCDYSFGIEGGLLAMPIESGYMQADVCAIYNGKTVALGFSPVFEWPKEVLKLILEGKVDASKAFKDLNLTHHEKLGAEDGGLTGMLTDQRMPREDYIKYGIIMALIQFEKPELY